jgi:hypothetical protein
MTPLAINLIVGWATRAGARNAPLPLRSKRAHLSDRVFLMHHSAVAHLLGLPDAAIDIF